MIFHLLLNSDSHVCLFQVVFSLCPLGLGEWWAVLKISVPVILLDEALKFVARNYVDGNNPACKGKLHYISKSQKSKELTMLVISWVLFIVLFAYTSDEIFGAPDEWFPVYLWPEVLA